MHIFFVILKMQFETHQLFFSFLYIAELHLGVVVHEFPDNQQCIMEALLITENNSEIDAKFDDCNRTLKKILLN